MRMHKGFHQVLQIKNIPHAFKLHANASALKLAAMAEGAAMLAGGRAPDSAFALRHLAAVAREARETASFNPENTA